MPVPDPEDVAWEDWEGWSAGLAQAIVSILAFTSPAKTTQKSYSSLLRTQPEGSLISVKQVAVQVERDLRDMSRELFLPDEKTLEKIMRCEAYLSRQLYQAMHELEALQTKRSGGAAPLARLKVQGLES